jgi:hypothetical protein
MSDEDTGYFEAKRLQAEAQRLRDEAFQFRADADIKLRDANYALGQARHRHKEISDFERSIAHREQRLLNELGEAKLIEREQAAEAKLAEARELMGRYEADRHAAAIYLRQCSEREAAEQSAA